MEFLRSYMLTVVTAAIVCALVQLLFEKDKRRYPAIRMVTGLVLTIVVIGPLVQGRRPRIDQYLSDIAYDGERLIEAGESAAGNAMAQCITDRTITYILDEANALGAELQVEVALGNGIPPAPVEITLQGQVSPYTKKRLTQLIKTDLGISEENQIWK